MKFGKSFLGVIVLALFDSSCGVSPYSEEGFRQPETKWHPVPLWFWNNTTVSGDVLEDNLQHMIETDGYGGCAILPFGANFQPNYLSEEYFTLYGQVIDKARQMGCQLSLYDEYGFPSGSMGAYNANGVPTFMNNHPGCTLKRLDKQEYEVSNDEPFVLDLRDAPGTLMAVVAVDTALGHTANLRNFIHQERLEWTPSEQGKWKVMTFRCVIDGAPLVDYLDPEAVKLFVEDTHEQYYRHFPDAFGTTITSTFFDEPTLYRAHGRIWSERFNEEFEQRYGYAPDTLYPALWYDMGGETARQRNMMFGLRAQLYAEGFMRVLAEWATAHHILSTGHQDQEEVANTTSVSGDLMLDGKYMTMPGIDKIGGARPAELYYKVVSSSAQNWDHTDVMSETYGAMGNLPMSEMYQIAIEQFTKGINNLIPHAVWYNDEDVSFLPELSWRNPLYQQELPAFNTFLARLRYMLARPGRHIADIAVLYPIHTLQAGHHLDGELGEYAGGVVVPGTDYPLVTSILTDSLGRDFTYVHPEVLDDRCRVEDDGMLVMQNPINTENFHVILLPGVKVITSANLHKIAQACEKGATVIFTTQIPSLSADDSATNEEIQSLVAQMLQRENAFFVENPTPKALQECLSEDTHIPDVAFSTTDHPFNYIHKEVQGAQVYYFGNIDSTPATCNIQLRHSMQDAWLMDPHSGSVAKMELCKNDGTTSFLLHLEPSQSLFLVEEKGLK